MNSSFDLSSTAGVGHCEFESFIKVEEFWTALSNCLDFENCFLAFFKKDAIWEVKYDALTNSLVQACVSHNRRFDASAYTRSINARADFKNTFLWSGEQVGERKLNQAPAQVNGIGFLSMESTLNSNQNAKFIILLSHRNASYELADQVMLNRITALLSACLARLPLAKGEAEFNLTKTELVIMSWVTRGKTSFEISKILEITERTVKFHLSNVYSKLGVCNRAQAVAAVNHLVSA